MSEITITLEGGERHGRYVGHVAGIEAEAALTFTHRGDHLVSADHTGAPEAMKGTGVAAALVERLIADARAAGCRILPYCPYVRARYLRNPGWQDVMMVSPGEVPG